MNQKITPAALLLLLIPTMLWAGNTVVGRVIYDMVPPITLNFIRWFIAFLILLLFGRQVLRRKSALWRHWREYAVLGFLGIGVYNTLQYMALHSSTPLNVTLVYSSMPVWMLLVGRLFFQATISFRQCIGALLSLVGVAIILSRGELSQLVHFRFVIGDIYMVIATIAWAFYSWLLTRDKHDAEISQNWATLLLAQVTFGVMWSGAFATGEYMLTDWHIDWSWGLVLAILYVAIGPAIIALRCWGLGVQRVGPTTAAFVANLMPVFTAILSMVFLNETPKAYHVVAFFLIAGGIVYSARRSA